MAPEYISSEIASILLFISPGFLTIALIGKFYGITVNMEQFEKTVWSLIASTPIGIVFIHLNDINNMDEFLNYFTIRPLTSTIEVIVSSIILALVVSLVIKYRLLEKISDRVIYHRASVFETDRTVWDRFLDKNFGKPIIVKTPDIEYKGWLSANSTRNEKREIVIDEPVIVYTDEDGNTEDYACGKQIMLLEEDIKSITVLEEDS